MSSTPRRSISHYLSTIYSFCQVRQVLRISSIKRTKWPTRVEDSDRTLLSICSRSTAELQNKRVRSAIMSFIKPSSNIIPSFAGFTIRHPSEGSGFTRRHPRPRLLPRVCPEVPLRPLPRPLLGVSFSTTQLARLNDWAGASTGFSAMLKARGRQNM